MPKIIQGEFKILSQQKAGPDYWRMGIQAPQIARRMRPGQFVHLRLNNQNAPLLRRPFSIHRFNQGNFEILYKVVGQGTRLLAKKKKGDTIDVLGPLGNGFDLSAISYPLSAILVAGGMGVAPLLALAESLTKNEKRKRKKEKKIIALIGAKTKKELVCIKEFQDLGIRVGLATDDGTCGHKGFVTGLLKKILNQSTINNKLSTVYACGPKPMLKEVAGIAKKTRIAAFGSLEERMACGVGACLGCAIKTKQGYQRVCQDGPVFNLKDIIWRKDE